MPNDSDSVLAKIVQAIQAVIIALPKLEKTERNNHANYSYASIDDFYEIVAKTAAKKGLNWVGREIAHEIKGETAAVTFSFRLYFKDGSVIDDFFQITIYHPLRGPQMSGSVASYADKVFMRQTYKVQTGEPDADHDGITYKIEYDAMAGRGAGAPRRDSRNQSTQPTQPFSPAPPRATPENGIMPILRNVRECKSIGDLLSYWNELGVVFSQMPREDVDRVTQVFTARRREIEDRPLVGGK